ncbi:related to signal peptidase 18 KD subunit [Lecanosticta acicola]|uniref:Signal peptidase complex subunit 2 n=1 Tax=Lecanosticta acicola TaxID=111012 RepID=A0AAI8Z519_9PEZI|nr:related to signal peptidase 18 KD subunit [Lecanosticta acicola]
MSDSRISPYSLNDLKNTTDDALANYLRGLSFKQDNSKLDIRLLLGYTAVIIAGVIFGLDYKYGWEATKTLTAVAVAVYGVLNSALTLWMWFVEKGLVFEGERDGNRISIYSKTKKHDPTYYITVTAVKPTSTPSEWQIRAPFTTWFTRDGYFVARPFQQWLATSIEAIGNVDTKNANRDERDELASPSDHHVLQSNGGVEATGLENTGKASKRSKKK